MLNIAPYSLGKLIDWKLDLKIWILGIDRSLGTPYSLGKLIDWKLLRDVIARAV
jgi:hypothetical protein